MELKLQGQTLPRGDTHIPRRADDSRIPRVLCTSL